MQSGVELTLSAEESRKLIGAQAPSFKRKLPSELRNGFTWFNFRFSDTRLSVERVTFAASPSPTRLNFTVYGKLDAKRERKRIRWRGLRTRVEWTPDGRKRLFDLKITGHLLLSHAGNKVNMAMRADRLHWKFLLRPGKGLAGSKAIRRLIRKEEVQLDVLRQLGATVKGVRVQRANNKQAVILVEI